MDSNNIKQDFSPSPKAEKFVLKSKSIGGAALSAASVLGLAVGVDLGPDTLAMLQAFGDKLGNVILAISGLVGFGLTIWGRITADSDLVLKTKTQEDVE